MEFDNTVSLKIDDKQYSGWLSVDVVVNLTGIARSFRVSATRNNSDGSVSIPFNSGSAVELMVGKNKLLTGYVEKIDVTYNSSSIGIEVNGNSKTIDLMQCQIPDGKPRSWKDVPLFDILRDLGSYYGVGVKANLDLITKDSLEVPPDKKIGEAITELLKKHSLLITDSADGDLVVVNVDKAEKSTDPLELGKNILSGKRSVDMSQVFSDYKVIGQAKNSGSNQSVKANQMSSSVVHNDGCRTRWSVLNSTGAAKQELLNKKANLQHNYTVASSDTYTYTVQGWRQSDGELWSVGNKVVIKDDFVRFPDEQTRKNEYGKSLAGIERIISKVSYKISSAGTTCEIECKSRDAFLNTEIPDDKKAGAIKKSKKTAGAKKKSGSSKGGGADLTGIKQGSGRTNSTGSWSR